MAMVFWFAGTAFAQAYPAKPIHVLLGFAPGGQSDLFTRMYSAELSKRVSQPVIVENRPGAGGIIAANAGNSGKSPFAGRCGCDRVDSRGDAANAVE